MPETGSVPGASSALSTAPAPVALSGAQPSGGAGGGAGRVDAFISYSHSDRDFALALRDGLQRRGKSVWLDERAIQPASDWEAALAHAISATDAFIFVISPASVASAECAKELAHALELNKRALPVVLHQTPLAQVPEALSRLQFIPARGLFTDDWEGSLEQLLTAIDTDLDWVRQHTDWGEKAGEWAAHDRDRSFLLSGLELRAAEDWLAGQSGKRPEPTDLHRQFVLSSRRSSARRARRLLSGVAVALVVAVVLAVVAVVQRQQADHQRNVALALSLRSSAQSLEGDQPQLAALLAAEADTREPTAAAQDLLRVALAGLRQRGYLPGGHFDGLSADGRRALAWGDGPGLLWELPQRHLLARVPDVTNAVFAPNGHGGQVAAYATAGGSVVTLDLATGRRLKQVPTGLGQVTDIVAAASAPLVMAADAGSNCALVDVAEGKVLAHVPGCQLPEISPSGKAYSYFSSDGRLVLVQRGRGAHAVNLASSSTLAVVFANDQDVAVTDSFHGLYVYGLDGRVVLHMATVYQPVFPPGAHWMVATMELGQNDLVARFAFPSGRLQTALGTLPTLPEDLAMSGDGTLVAVAEAQRDLVSLVSPADGQVLGSLVTSANVTDVAVDRTGSRLLTLDGLSSAAGVDATPDVWDGLALPAYRTLALPSSLSGAQLSISAGATTALLTTPQWACWARDGAPGGCDRGYFADGALTPDGDRAVALYQKGNLPSGVPSSDAVIMSLPSGRLLDVLKPTGTYDFIDAITLSPSGRLVATGDAGGLVRVWYTSTGKPAWSVQVPTIALNDVSWGPDGSTLAVAGQGGAWLYSASTHRRLQSFRAPSGGDEGNPPGFCQQNISGSCPSLQSAVPLAGHRLVADYDGYQFVLYDTRSGRAIANIDPPGRFIDSTDLARSAGGGEFAISTNEGVVRTYLASNGAQVGAGLDLDPTAGNGVLPVALTGGGRVLMSVDDGELSVWLVASGQLLARQAADSMAIAGDGATLATLGEGRLSDFSCPFCGSASLLLPDAHSLVTRPFTEAQRSTYLAGQAPLFKVG